MDGQTTSDELDFSASGSTTEQTESMNSAPVQAVNEQSDSANADDSLETTTPNDQVEGQGDVQVNEDDVIDFLAKKGINPESEDLKAEFYKLGKMALNSEKGFTSSRQELANLRRQLKEEQEPQPQNQTQPENNGISMYGGRTAEQFQQEVDNWEKERNLTPEENDKMIAWLGTPIGKNPVTGEPILRMYLVANGSLSLDDAYNAAGCGMVKAEALKSKMRGEVEKEIAARQSAKRPGASATNSTQFGDSGGSDPFRDELLND